MHLTYLCCFQGIPAERVLPVRDAVQHQPVPRLPHPRRRTRPQRDHARRGAQTGAMLCLKIVTYFCLADWVIGLYYKII